VLFDGPDDDRDPHIARMRDGTLVCSFFPYRQAPGAKPEYETAIVTSRDGGWTWDAEPRVLAPGWAVSAPMRELSDGTRLLGVYHEDGDTAYGGVLRSTDQGRTWSAPIAIGKGGGVRLDAETDVLELKDGRVLAALRGDKVPLHFARSGDRGLSWSPVESSGFPGHCPHFTRLGTGEILLTHRLPQTAMHVSRDDGATWSGPHAIDSVIGAYPATVELRDGSVLVVYYEEGTASAIRARRFRLGDSGPVWLPLEPEVRDVGSRRELFVDRSLIDRMDGCVLRLHTPGSRWPEKTVPPTRSPATPRAATASPGESPTSASSRSPAPAATTWCWPGRRPSRTTSPPSSTAAPACRVTSASRPSPAPPRAACTPSPPPTASAGDAWAPARC